MSCITRRRGRYVIDFYDQHGKRRWKTMKKDATRKEAIEYLGDIEKKIRHGSFIPNKALPYFTEIADQWLSSKEPNIRHSTYDQYQGHLKCHLKPYFKKAKIHQITFDSIEKFKKHSLDCGVSIPTLKKILVNLGAILTHAVRMRYIDFNPAREIEKPRGKSLHEGKDMVVLNPESIRALLEAAATWKDRVFFMTAVMTGMREGELIGLKWGDFDWFNSQVYVQRTFNHGRFYEPKSKTSKRKIDLAPELVSELKKWKLACPLSELDLVFPTDSGTIDNPANMFYRRFLPSLRRAGLPRMRFHNLRHTFVSLLIAQGEHPKYIQVQAGHSSINVTMDTYGHLMVNVNKEAASKLGQAIWSTENTVLKENGCKMVAVTEKGLAL